ncbi:KCC4 kinase, partial [Pterocles burchelli]|nr:KCC4 kinase [Pterocles burchelli]
VQPQHPASRIPIPPLHPSCPPQIKLKEIFETPAEIALVLELVTGGELFDRIVERGFYSERDAAHVVKQILEAVSVMCPLCVLYVSPACPPQERCLSPCPQPPKGVAGGGIPPEPHLGLRMRREEGQRGSASQVGWRWGFHGNGRWWVAPLSRPCRLCGFEPFFDPRGDQYMYGRILTCDYEFVSPWWDEVSLNAKDLVRKLIVLDPQKRLTVSQALEHPWVTGKAAKFAHMDSTQKKLQEFNARRKLK